MNLLEARRLLARDRGNGLWLELLGIPGILPPEKLPPLRQETDGLTAIFVTILKQPKAS